MPLACCCRKKDAGGGADAKEEAPVLHFSLRMVNLEELQKLIDSEKNLVVVDIHDQTLQLCREVTEKLAEREPDHPDVSFVRVNVNDDIEVGRALGVEWLPTWKLYWAGELVMTIMTVKDVAEVVEKAIGDVDVSKYDAKPPAIKGKEAKEEVVETGFQLKKMCISCGAGSIAMKADQIV